MPLPEEYRAFAAQCMLPHSAVPRNVDLSDVLKSAQETAQKLFGSLPISPERNGILSALGRLGKSSLKRKIRHRAAIVFDAAKDRFPDLAFVCDRAVECRNHYVHGSDAEFPYEANFGAAHFLTSTLEFVFAVSDLLECGWNFGKWLGRGTTLSHPFASYQYEYKQRLENLKELVKTGR